MKQRGRKQNLAVVTDSPISSQDRPEPPNELTPEQRIEWISVVNSLPADWFEDYSTQTLVQYCKHVIEARRIAKLIDKLANFDDEEFDLIAFTKTYDKLLAMQERETRGILACMRSMRLTQQSTWSDQKSKPKQVKVKSPWEN